MTEETEPKVRVSIGVELRHASITISLPKSLAEDFDRRFHGDEDDDWSLVEEVTDVPGVLDQILDAGDWELTDFDIEPSGGER